MIAPIALAAYLSTCAPSVAPDTMRAIISVESGGNELAINDNTLKRSFMAHDYTSALQLVRTLLAHGDSVDVGLAQVNSANFTGYHVPPERMLEPCANLRVASAILAGAYQRSMQRFPEPREALWHAIMAYNTGSLFAGVSYVRAVVNAAFVRPIVPTISLLTLAPIMPPASLVGTIRPIPSLAPIVKVSPRKAQNDTALVALEHAGIPHTLDVQIHHTDKEKS